MHSKCSYQLKMIIAFELVKETIVKGRLVLWAVIVNI